MDARTHIRGIRHQGMTDLLAIDSSSRLLDTTMKSLFSPRRIFQTGVLFCALLGAMTPFTSRAVSLEDYARVNTIRIFVARKGAVMPNAYDSPGHLKEGTKALLLSGCTSM
jgi:hypothetical protein